MNNIEIVCFLEGFSIAFSLIISVGPQNTFLIKQGIKREYVFVVATICLLLESCLIVTGVFTAKVIISLLNISINKALLIGAGFLLLFGTISFISIFQKKKIEIQSTIKHNSLTKIIISTFFLSLLNPGIIIESLLIIGSICQATRKINFNDMLNCAWRHVNFITRFLKHNPSFVIFNLYIFLFF